MSTGTSSNALGGNPSHLPNEQAPIDEGPLLDLPSGGDTLVRAADAPRYIGIAAQTLARWRHEGRPPAFCRLGRRVFYRVADLREWIRASVRQNTINAA